MAEYIDRDKVLDAVSELPPKMDEQGYGWIARMGLYQLLLDFPSADVQPLEYGEWTAEGNDEYGNYWDECTACRKAVFFPPSVKNDYKYCPHCGARMDGET